MTTSISRAQFLRGDFSGRRAAPRPPWALSGEAFFDRCTRCGACQTACPGGLIQPGSGGYPTLVFERGGCDFCGACAVACAPGALRRDSVGATPWTLKAQVGAGCLARQGVHCRICAEHCEVRAIRIRPSVGGRAQPVIDAQACTGCGACYSPCPSRAIALADIPGAAGASTP